METRTFSPPFRVYLGNDRASFYREGDWRAAFFIAGPGSNEIPEKLYARLKLDEFDPKQIPKVQHKPPTAQDDIAARPNRKEEILEKR